MSVRKITIGILAHADAGKTTLSEALLYSTGEIRKPGRVDHGDSFLDDNIIERNRGITIFSRQAIFRIKGSAGAGKESIKAGASGTAAGKSSNKTNEYSAAGGMHNYSSGNVSSESDVLEVTLIDTPGHVDFAAEMERSLSVIDYALLVVSGSEGVQAHTKTLWRMLKAREIPVIVFINKMDIAVRSREDIIGDLRKELNMNAVDFRDAAALTDEYIDDITLYSPELAEKVLEGEEPENGEIADAVIRGQIVPCVFGSALRMSGISELLETIRAYTKEPARGSSFGARVYKVARSDDGERLCFIKISGGELRVRDRVMLRSRRAGAAGSKVGAGAEANQKRNDSGSHRVSTEAASGGAGAEANQKRNDSGSHRVSTEAASGGAGAETSQKRNDSGSCGVSTEAASGGAGAETSQKRNDSGSCRVSTGTETASAGIEVKINQIRLYSGSRWVSAETVSAGTVCAVTGLAEAIPGDGLGTEEPLEDAEIRPFMVYRVQFPEDIDPGRVMDDLKMLTAEDPALSASWSHSGDGIEIRLMGQVQLEVLQAHIKERFGYEVSFGRGNVLYLETITDVYEGVGHFEPLRHYAEVHLIVEPGERGSGIVLSDDVPEDELALNWRRLILTHLEEKEHTGTLAGFPLTDVRISIAAGRAHDKHTVGGDFREATYRAVRNALMQARRDGNISILEPWCTYEIEVPPKHVGRAMTDIRQMGGTQNGLEQDTEVSRLSGKVPAAEINGYQQILTSYTSGAGRLSLTPCGYDVCHNQESVISERGYDPERDISDPADSVFVNHSGSDIVKWYDVPEHMHMGSVLEKMQRIRDEAGYYAGSLSGCKGNYYGRYTAGGSLPVRGTYAGAEGHAGRYGKPGRCSAGSGSSGAGRIADVREEARRRAAAEKELRAIFERTYGPSKQNRRIDKRMTDYREKPVLTEEEAARNAARSEEIRAKHERKTKDPEEKPVLVLIDGYNLIFADQYLRELGEADIGSARDQLIERLSNYAGYTGCELAVVFDAYKVVPGAGSEEMHNGVRVIYTKENEPADIRIGKMTGSIKGMQIYTVSSDELVQQDAWAHGALRISSREFLDLLARTEEEIRSRLKDCN